MILTIKYVYGMLKVDKNHGEKVEQDQGRKLLAVLGGMVSLRRWGLSKDLEEVRKLVKQEHGGECSGPRDQLEQIL